ncbi:PREDICTED: probable peroxisomal membrane protein PEX13 [Rhagoletis zephyria]|uniref:probable peroxisomal membrane protein PEX13 n=1 Tax=Rhagoletis zephyria TaxID=28612 RepID=UPI0008113938|nr:PREDICTED: probable peroxisomal membrane protein PEX13 [Rhagoletis zephyria]
MVDIGDSANNFRSPVLVEPNLIPPSGIAAGAGVSMMGGTSDTQLRTPFAGNVRSLQPPPLPQSPYGVIPSSYNANTGFGGYGGYAGYNGIGNAIGSYGGYGSFGGFGSYGGYGGGFGSAYNRFGMGGINPMDPETRFIQLAEASSRPAFESIESLVSAIGNIAAMLDSTFFALTSSFRAILGVAANFGRLRGVFAQFWQTFAVYRGLTWIYKKILYWLRLSEMDPSSEKFKQAFAEALNDSSQQPGAPKLPRKGQSPWPVLAFISFIFTAPYLIMRLLGTVTNTAQEEARNPTKWMNPIETIAMYDFQARNPSELSIQCNQPLLIAPKEIQNTLGMLNTGWATACTVDRQSVGIIPINYVKSPQQLREEQLQQQHIQQQLPMMKSMTQKEPKINTEPQPSLMDLSTASFRAPPVMQQKGNVLDVPDFDIAPQPVGPSSTAAMLAASGSSEV